MVQKQPAKQKLLQPLPARWLSAFIMVGCLVLLWTSVLQQNAPSHGVATMLLITAGLSAFHAIGWRPRFKIERWILSPIGSFLLIGITYLLHSNA